ncbi:MAG: DNA repair protein RecN, partial [Deltaproteobacteria bacterium]|nr:DNA repair protein RecN [Deltaproteobacteria bacterium]
PDNMLQELIIKNFAIIDDLHICFSDRLTIISGETGTGKSIIINAVNLILGSRVNAALIRTGSGTAELEAMFKIEHGTRAAAIMEEHGFDISEGLLIRRVISNSDKHKIYINGRIATVQMLTSITEGLMPLRQQVYHCFHETVPLTKKLNDLMKLKDTQTERIDFINFQKNEIISASIVLDEDKSLEQERIRLKNGEELYRITHGSIETLYSAEGSILERLAEIKKELDKAGQIDPELMAKAKGIDEIVFGVEDIAGQLSNYLKNIQIDEGRLEEVEARIDTLQKLKRKYGGSLEAVLSFLKSIENELSEIENVSEKISETEAKLAMQHEKLVELAAELSEKRKAAAKTLAGKVESELTSLKMDQSAFEVSLRTAQAADDTDPHLVADGSVIKETGMDQATFMISANVGEDLKPLANIASGGELSRVVLALKAILAQSESVETVVFDEVDAGIGGGVAEVVGKKLATLADHHQIICITHLPQIAKFGNHHFSVSKNVANGRTKTVINQLSEEDRLEEIARMLGGEEITQTTLDHAREMLNVGQ